MWLILTFLLSIANLNQDEGSGLDPHGGASITRGDEGCGLDPFGRCTQQLTTDEGNGFDPHGKP